nr:quinate permease [Quercus suber]
MTGLGFGCVYIATNLYVAECAPRLLRGSFVGTVSQFGYQLGTLIAFWTGYGMSYHTSPYNIAWRVSNAIQIPIGLMFVVISFWYPESPRWLLEKHPEEPERALKTLAKIRSGSPTDMHVTDEFHEMVASYEYRKRFDPGYLGLFKSAAMRKRLAYGFYATALQQVGGIAALTTYATLIYRSLGWDQGHQALAINGIQSVLQLLIVLVNTFTVDKFGRKQLLIVGFAIQALALLILSSLTTAFPHNSNQAAAVVEIAMFFIVGLTYCWSNGPIAPAIASEIFPQHVRDKAFGISLLGQTACLLAITQPWPQFNAEVGQKSYWLLFSLNTAAMVSVIFILPETKGISLERMDAIFGAVDAVEGGEYEEGKEIAAMKGQSLAQSIGIDGEKAGSVELVEERRRDEELTGRQ